MDDGALQRWVGALRGGLRGQDAAVTGVVLGLLAREHVYLEGPPGCGKSWLAESAARSAGARTALLALHRDTRPDELLGDPVLRRRRVPGGERISVDSGPGPLAEAEVVVLDDLPRAPGEALGPLLRALSARRARGRPLPLETAIATATPAESADPLEPAQLDRFAIQVRLRGLLVARRFDAARAVLDGVEELAPEARLDTVLRHALQRRAAALPVPAEVERLLVALVQRLHEESAGEALLTDRTFGLAMPRVLRAHALLRGAARVEPTDLRALQYMLAGRVPERVQQALEELLAAVVAGEPRPLSHHAGAGRGEAQGAGGEAARVPEAGAIEDAREAVPPPPGRRGEAALADVAVLLRALEGRIERARVDRDGHPGGSPRSYRSLRRLDELLDADPVDAVLYTEGRLPGTPRAYRRQRRAAGGALAVLRDVSASMEGRLAAWAGQVVAGIVRTGARQRMRVGYVEFNHQAERHDAAGRFFHRRYGQLLGLAARRRAEGRTSYEAPLRVALAEFARRAGRSGRHVVLLTDGVPVVGDPAVRAERLLARRLGVRVHTVFLGLGECPAVLDEISRETGGLAFVGRPGADGRLRVRLRGAA